MNYKNYNTCIDQLNKDLEYPTDKNSLFAQKIYDKQTAARRCNEKYPIKIIEGFDSNSLNIKSIIGCLVLILLIYLIFLVFVGFTTDTIHLGIESIKPTNSASYLDPSGILNSSKNYFLK